VAPVPLADQLIDAAAAGALIQWEVYASAGVDTAVQAATAALGYTVQALRSLAEPVLAVIREAAAAAIGVGVALAAEAARLLSDRRPPSPRTPARILRQLLGRAVSPEVQTHITLDVAVNRIAEQGWDPREAIRQAHIALQAQAATAVNQAASAGADYVARATGAPGLMWVSERNGCLGCTALTGQVIDIGGQFDGARTWGDRPIAWGGFAGRPPRHPRCRCRTAPWYGGVASEDAAAALRREAQRSILRGWSLPSESEAARLRAAERLLASSELDMPITVRRYALRALAAGEFPLGREVPV
jgi:hypothetical protein